MMLNTAKTKDSHAPSVSIANAGTEMTGGTSADLEFFTTLVVFKASRLSATTAVALEACASWYSFLPKAIMSMSLAMITPARCSGSGGRGAGLYSSCQRVVVGFGEGAGTPSACKRGLGVADLEDATIPALGGSGSVLGVKLG